MNFMLIKTVEIRSSCYKLIYWKSVFALIKLANAALSHMTALHVFAGALH